MIGLGMILTAAYVPNWTGAAVLSGWVVLSLMLPFYLLRRVEMGLSHWLGLIFLAYATLSILWAPVWQQAVWDLWLTWVLAFAFCLGAQSDEIEWVPAGGCAPPIGVKRKPLRKLWIGMALGLSVCDGFALAQWLGYHPIFANNQITFAGSYVNPDMFGETACLLTIALITVRAWWPLILTVPPIYFTQSRTVWVAYVAAIAFWAWERFRWRAVLPALILILGVGLFVTSNTASRPHATDAIEERFALWQDTLGGITPTGWGAGSFYMLYPAFANRTDTMYTRPEDPHNEFLNLAFEYGLGAIPAIAVLALGFLGRGPERYILVAFLSIAFFSFPTRIPTEGFIGLVALGRLCRRGNLAWADELLGRSRDYCRALLSRRRDRALQPLHPHKAGI